MYCAVGMRRVRRREGFTLIELLVVITIIGILASLILPGVNNVRMTARRVECLNNMRQVGMAAQSFLSTHDSKIPYLHTGVYNGSSGQWDTGELVINYGTHATPDLKRAPWTIHLLPYLEQAGLYERLTSSVNEPSATETTRELLSLRLKTYLCPSDYTIDTDGPLSFVANAGIVSACWPEHPNPMGVTTPLYDHTIDLNNWGHNRTSSSDPKDSSDARVSLSTGVFWGEMGSMGMRMSADLIGQSDGQSQTLMFSENLQAQFWGGNDRTFAEAGTIMNYSFFTTTNFAGAPCTIDSSVGLGCFGISAENGGTLATALQMSPSDMNAPSGINSEQHADEGTLARPSSAHPGGVNVIFCDGSGRFLNDHINRGIYVALLTPGGNRLGQAILDGNSY